MTPSSRAKKLWAECGLSGPLPSLVNCPPLSGWQGLWSKPVVVYPHVPSLFMVAIRGIKTQRDVAIVHLLQTWAD